MKKRLPRLWVAIAIAVLLTVGIIATVVAANAEEPPEFYFTRLVYTQNSARTQFHDLCDDALKAQ